MQENYTNSSREELIINPHDIIFALTINGSEYKKDITPIVSKITIINQTLTVNLYQLSKNLEHMNIKELLIFSIHQGESTNIFSINNGWCKINYIETSTESFINFLNDPNPNLYFREYNKHSIYILRDSDYIHVKNLFKSIENNSVNIGRGGSQKAHMISPLDFRLSSYLLAMCNFNYILFSSLNTFNYINKESYLLYKERSFKRNNS